MHYKATMGTVSHATLRSEDLIETFRDELRHLVGKDNSFAAILTDCDNWLASTGNNESERDDLDFCGSELINEMIDALNELAPAYCYFGAHEGDGSDFGFWPCMEMIEELPQISDPSDSGLGEECVFVNDHGNVTVYAANGDVVFEIV